MRIWMMDIEHGKDWKNIRYKLEGEENSRKTFRDELESGKPNIKKPEDLCLGLRSGNIPCDCCKLDPYIPEAPVFSQRAKDCLEELLKDCVEFIPIKYEAQTCYIVHIPGFLDAVDYDRAKIAKGFPPSFLIEAFVPEIIAGINLFKVLLNGYPKIVPIYVTDAVKEKVEQDGLTGFRFLPAWDSEGVGIIEEPKKKIEESGYANARVLSLEWHTLGDTATLVFETAKGNVCYSFADCYRIEIRHSDEQEKQPSYFMQNIELEEIPLLRPTKRAMEFKILMGSLSLHVICRNFDVTYSDF